MKSKRAAHTFQAHSDKGVLGILPAWLPPPSAEDGSADDDCGVTATARSSVKLTPALPTEGTAARADIEDNSTESRGLDRSGEGSLLTQGRDGELAVWANVWKEDDGGGSKRPHKKTDAPRHVVSYMPGGLGFCRCAKAPQPPLGSNVAHWNADAAATKGSSHGSEANVPADDGGNRSGDGILHSISLPLLALPADDASEIALFVLNPGAERNAEAFATLAAPATAKPTGMCMCVEFHWIRREAFEQARRASTQFDVPEGVDADGPEGAKVERGREMDGGGGSSAGNAGASAGGSDVGHSGASTGDHVLVLIAGYEDGTSIVWDVASLSALHRSPRHSEPMLCVAADGKRDLLSVSGSAGMTLTVAPVWPALAGAKAKSRTLQIELKHPGINAVVHRDDFKLLATAGWDNRVRLFSWPKMKPLAILESHTSAINCLVWSRPLPSLGSIRLLAACSKDSRISLWSMYNEQ